MSGQQHVFKKFNHSGIYESLTNLELPADQIKMLQDLKYDLPVLNKLLGLNHFEPAIHYLASGLPKREAIWWGLLCSQQVETGSGNPLMQEALVLVEDWVIAPTEEKRRKAGQLGEALEHYTASAWVATAVLWSGGSISKEGKPEIEPSDNMCGGAVANAIILASGKVDRTKSNEHIQQFIKRGIHIAMGGNGKINFD